MRTIKFRGFHADENVGVVIKLDGKEIRGLWIVGDLEQCGGSCWIEQQMVISETVGQFTGCADRNGREIFEGDILISNKEFAYSRRYQIVYNIKFAGFIGIREGANFVNFYNDTTDYTKSGNIFENPELLEVEE